MKTSNPPVPTIGDTEIKLLRVFSAVVRNGGFSAAQSDLNISQPAISNYMNTLEQRLGVKLCERGRRGFALTEEGRKIFEVSTGVLESLEGLRREVGKIRGEVAGDFHFGFLDAMAFNPDTPIWACLREFGIAMPEVRLNVTTDVPQALISGLMDGTYDAVVCILIHKTSRVESVPVFSSKQHLYCGKLSPLFRRKHAQITKEEICDYPYAGRFHVRGWVPENVPYLNEVAWASGMEGIAGLILTGHYIGHLPKHFADIWVMRGEMRPLFEDEFSFQRQAYLLTRRGNTSETVQRFAAIVSELTNSTGDF